VEVVITGLGSTTNFLEVRRPETTAGCLKRAVGFKADVYPGGQVCNDDQRGTSTHLQTLSLCPFCGRKEQRPQKCPSQSCGRLDSNVQKESKSLMTCHYQQIVPNQVSTSSRDSQYRTTNRRVNRSMFTHTRGGPGLQLGKSCAEKPLLAPVWFPQHQ
jgi:hypothetical protein